MRLTTSRHRRIVAVTTTATGLKLSRTTVAAGAGATSARRSGRTLHPPQAQAAATSRSPRPGWTAAGTGASVGRAVATESARARRPRGMARDETSDPAREPVTAHGPDDVFFFFFFFYRSSSRSRAIPRQLAPFRSRARRGAVDRCPPESVRSCRIVFRNVVEREQVPRLRAAAGQIARCNRGAEPPGRTATEQVAVRANRVEGPGASARCGSPHAARFQHSISVVRREIGGFDDGVKLRDDPAGPSPGRFIVRRNAEGREPGRPQAQAADQIELPYPRGGARAERAGLGMTNDQDHD